jgi:hypothetical protein
LDYPPEVLVGRDGIEPPTPGFSGLIVDRPHRQHFNQFVYRRRVARIAVSGGLLRPVTWRG